jgi:hypothetical protein
VSAAREDGAVFVGRRDATRLRDPLTALFAGVPRERSGLAYAAGYAGLLSLFRYSFAPLTMSGWWAASALGWGLVFCFNLLAPLALALSFAAAVSLDRAPWRSGRLPAVFAILVGWHGSYEFVFLLYLFWGWLASLG